MTNGELSPTLAQYRVLVELCRDGACNREIARRLHCSVDTVKCHLARLMAATETYSRAELAVRILRREILVKKP